MQTGLEGKPFYYGAIAALVVSGVVFWIAHTFWFQEMQATIQRQEVKLTDLQAQLQKGRIAKQQLPQFREEVRRLEGELDKLLRILPARRNTPELLRRIRALTEQGSFDILRIQPGNFVDRDFYSEWPININLNGTYHNLALFFDRISRFSRIINIDSLTVSGLREQRTGHTISAQFQAKTFIYKEPAPEEEMDVTGGGR
ncbi:MAG: type 4a pilus biogenesis protein PilO [Thermoanaerobaculia bacterium]|nr:type 4a pilus biogenesis protein PilO [Thermoanaerobaculia bacterium]